MITRSLLLSGLYCFAMTLTANAAQIPVDSLYRNTYYFVTSEDLYPPGPPFVQILTMKDAVLATVSPSFQKALFLEGTGKLLDGRMLNFSGRKDGVSRFRVTANPYGDGVGTCALVPFHTVAVDPARIALGSVVEIKETIGMRLPDGTLHDGTWRAEDIGGAIQADRIDLFVGIGDQGAVLSKAGIGHLQALQVKVLSPPSADTCVNKLPDEASGL